MSTPERTLASVHSLYVHNARQIPECMHACASQLEQGKLGEVRSAVCVLEDAQGRLGVYLWGDMTPHDMIALMARAQHEACKSLDEGRIPVELVPAV